MNSPDIIKSENEEKAEAEIEGGTRFDVLDMVEEPFDDTVSSFSSEDDLEDAMHFISKSKGETSTTSSATASAADDAAAQDDIRMEHVLEDASNVPNDYEEFFVAERPIYPAVYPLPKGWEEVYHKSGVTIYVHRETNTCSLSRPYYLGAGSTKCHRLTTAAVPCYSYRLGKQMAEVKNDDDRTTSIDADAKAETNAAIDNPSADDAAVANPAATADTVDATTSTTNARSSASATRATPEDIEAKQREKEIIDYCKRLFRFKSIKYLKFRSWDVRRTFLRTLRNERNRRKCPFSAHKYMTLPIETKDAEGNVVATKNWIINPRGRSYVAILHEYLQQSKKAYPEYKFSEVDNARTPYSATVVVNGVEYASGVGMSKREAKFEAAKATLQVLLPKMMKYVLSVCCEKSGDRKFDDCSDDEEDGNVASAFDSIPVTDPRVSELSARTTEPKPYELLLNCLRKKGLQPNDVKFDFQDASQECTMSVAENQVTIKCDNKRSGKQLAAQSLLQLLHPHVDNWGSMLRLYGTATANQYRQVLDDKENENFRTRPENKELLRYLRERMGGLREDDRVVH